MYVCMYICIGVRVYVSISEYPRDDLLVRCFLQGVHDGAKTGERTILDRLVDAVKVLELHTTRPCERYVRLYVCRFV